MRQSIAFFFAAMLGVSSVPAGQSASTVVRDPNALNILAKTILQSGGAQAIVSVTNYEFTGTITYHGPDEEVTGSVKASALGNDKFRFDSTLSSGNRTTVVNGSEGYERRVNGSTEILPFSVAARLGNLTFPTANLALAVSNDSNTVTSTGPITYRDHQVYDVRIKQPVDSQRQPAAGTLATLDREYLIDATTFVVVGTREHFPNAGSPDEGRLHEMLFSDYRAIDGVSFPYSIAEYSDDCPTFSIQVDQVSVNPGIDQETFKQ